MEGLWIGKRGTCHFCFFDTKESTGTVFQSIEFSEDWEDPPFKWYPQPPESSVKSAYDAEKELAKQGDDFLSGKCLLERMGKRWSR
jgi:hypothetical protein